MPRKRIQVKEEPSELKRIEVSIAGNRREPAIRMLRFLAESPESTLSEVASILNRPERTVRRWWQAYVAGGIDGLLDSTPAGGKRPSKLAPEELVAFRVRAQSGFSELKEAQQWLVREFGVTYSLSRVSELLNGESRPEAIAPLSPTPSAEPAASPSPNVDLVSFLNALPTSTDSVEWIQQFSALLKRLLVDVDRISININNQIDISGRADICLMRFIQYQSADVDSDSCLTCVEYDSKISPSLQLLEDWKRQGRPVHLYQEPVSLDYFSAVGNEHLGSLILWRLQEQEPISQNTLNLLEQLRPFIDFALTDAVARHQCCNPHHESFHTTIAALAKEAKLTTQEYRVIALRLLGHSYKDIAEMLFVSVGTIKKHLNRVHHKSQTHSQTELFARYFSSRKWT